MPNRRVHLKFDEYLKSHGIIFDYTFAETVHIKMDKGTVLAGRNMSSKRPRPKITGEAARILREAARLTECRLKERGLWREEA